MILALKALGVGQTDEVILPTYVCRSVIEAIFTVGARPVLCDIGNEWTITAETVATKVTPRTAAIIVVHIFGIRTDTASLERFDVPIIEDACQAFTAKAIETGRDTGGSVAVLSFHAIKCLTTGEGEMAVSNDTGLVKRMREFRDGVDSAPGNRVASPMTDLQAALRRVFETPKRYCRTILHRAC